jgi:CRP-like cAMP-binding protein
MFTPSCSICDSKTCYIRAFTGNDWRKKINTERLTISLRKGDVLFREGDPVMGIFFIYRGKVKVYNTGSQKRTQIVRFAGSGSIVGHRGFGTLNKYPIGAAALEDSIVCFIPRQLFFDTLVDNPPLTMELLNFYADELRRAEKKLLSLSQMTVKQKLSECILTLSEIFGTTTIDGIEFLNVKLSRQDYADVIGSSIEEVIRTISQMKKEGLIMSDGKGIGLADLKRLKELIAEFGQLRLP